MHTTSHFGRAAAKKITLVLSAVVLTATLASCSEVSSRGETSSLSGESSTAVSSESEANPGTYDLGLPTSAPLAGPEPGSSQTINLASGRKFILHVPSSYQPGKKWPVVLAFHGWKETAEMMQRYTELDAADAIVA